jgi:hypothetical protein
MKNDDFWHWRQACYDYMIELSSQYNLKPVNVMSQLFFHAILTLTHNVTAFHCLKWYVKLYTKVGNITGKKDTVGLLFEIVDSDNKIYYIPVVGNHDNKIYYIPVVGNHHLCRNPNGTYTGPWCYTDSTYRHKELCDIPKCGESMYNILSFISRLDIFFLVSLTDTEKYWLV